MCMFRDYFSLLALPDIERDFLSNILFYKFPVVSLKYIKGGSLPGLHIILTGETLQYDA